MQDVIRIDDDFASAMQELSAQASGKGPGRNGTVADHGDGGEEVAALQKSLDQFAMSTAARLEGLALSVSKGLSEKLDRVEEQMKAIRSSESVNQRLFDSMHEEMVKYRDDFLRESLQKPFIRDLIVLFDDLSKLSTQLGRAEADGAAAGIIGQWHANLENAIHSLLEVLRRLEVTLIEPGEKVDRTLHRVMSFEPADFKEEDGSIVLRLKRGFLWRESVLRQEEVIAKRFE